VFARLVCRGLNAGRYAYLENPFDGIDVSHSSWSIHSELNLMGSNSLSAAFIAGVSQEAI
jgi:hypothetical protein